MKISAVETHLAAPKWDSDPGWTLGDRNSAAFVRIRTDEGPTGIGETILGHFAPLVVPPIVDYFRRKLIGEDPFRIDYLWHKLYQDGIWWGRKGAGLSVLSGIDMALWDLKGNALGVPVYELLGGRAHDRVPVYASAGEALWPPEKTVEKVKRYAAAGYRAAKVGTMAASQPYYTYDAKTSQARFKTPPVSRYAEMDAEKFAALRTALGTEFDLAVDGHQGAHPRPTTAHEAIRIANAIEPYGILFYEEPLSYEDLPGWVELRRRTEVPIAGGESLSGVAEFEQFISAGALDIVQPDVSHVGGITAAKRVLELADANRLRSAIHTGGTPGPGFAASLHLAIAQHGTLILERVHATAGTQARLIKDHLDLVDGAIAAPTCPGLGLDVTDEYLAANPFEPGMGVRS
ncbi:MAG TPA: mandelate racemase/muconate lactonizing enzyme family protein [Candidatus Limnocylindria bacterium]|jgi:L-alanine-DL-glutamate epimerase-like enolase superfamily enzyme|nr:mandelate racemase/muconate lactonizing enzyme family protein [Candidatus Limnocylindria bacterium]